MSKMPSYNELMQFTNEDAEIEASLSRNVDENRMEQFGHLSHLGEPMQISNGNTILDTNGMNKPGNEETQIKHLSCKIKNI